ncbi:MAG: enoyl-CoA hydratase/isomerase family protein [Alphaproteobacteria bacterium]
MIERTATGGVVTLTLNRPERRNALDDAAMHALAVELEALGDDARCVVIRGAGPSFSAGRDLKQAAELDQQAALTQHRRWADVFRTLRRLPCPSLAVVQGNAVAGGFTLALACDFLIAERSAKFGALEMANGFPAAMCTPILAHKAPPALGLEMALFGQPVTATRLAEAGLINRLVDRAEDLDAAVDEFVGRILELDPLAVRQTIETYRAARTMPLEQAFTMGEHLNQLIEASGGFKRKGDPR